MSLTAAMQEAYAANPAGVSVIETIELNHVTFASRCGSQPACKRILACR